MEEFPARGEHWRRAAFPESALLLGEVRHSRAHYCSASIRLGAAHLKLAGQVVAPGKIGFSF